MIQSLNINQLFSSITFTFVFAITMVFPVQGETSGKIKDLDLAPEIIESSPVLQRWQEEIPNILEQIRHEPSFPTRIRAGYSFFPSSGHRSGWSVGVEDLFIGKTGLTLSGDYYASFDGNREATGIEARYYVMPLGNYVNFAPTVGYRYIKTDDYNTDGIKVGARANFALSPLGGADLAISQNFISPGGEDEVGITNFSVSYALTQNLRLSTEIERQNSRGDQDSRLGIMLEFFE
jgi:hypothetical protein